MSPLLHGQFAEHPGSCVYGGLWVGEGSPISNIGGYRKSSVELLQELGVPVLRWPGGCFADDHHWREGVGQRKQPLQPLGCQTLHVQHRADYQCAAIATDHRRA